MPLYLELVGQLRQGGINTELHLESAKLGKQLKYASKAGIQFAVIAGSEEANKGVVMVKDLRKEEQFEVQRVDLVKTLRVEIEAAHALHQIAQKH
jgi:histidyl-tRNA synthetase